MAVFQSVWLRSFCDVKNKDVRSSMRSGIDTSPLNQRLSGANLAGVISWFSCDTR